MLYVEDGGSKQRMLNLFYFCGLKRLAFGNEQTILDADLLVGASQICFQLDMVTDILPNVESYNIIEQKKIELEGITIFKTPNNCKTAYSKNELQLYWLRRMVCPQSTSRLQSQNNKMIRQRTRQKQRQIRTHKHQLDITEQSQRQLSYGQKNQLGTKYRLREPINRKMQLQLREEVKYQSQGRYNYTPKDNKTEKNYNIINKQRKDSELFSIQRNRFQTVKKDKDQLPRIKLSNNSKQQLQIFQLQQPPQTLPSQILIHPHPHPPKHGNGTIPLRSGWIYKGQYNNQLFHGHGELYCKQVLIYSGTFQFGYFHGYGKLRNCQDFNFLIFSRDLYTALTIRHTNSNKNSCLQGENQSYFKQSNWVMYGGQFKQGKVDGFGQVWFSSGEKVATKWTGGRPDLQKWIVVHNE